MKPDQVFMQFFLKSNITYGILLFCLSFLTPYAVQAMDGMGDMPGMSGPAGRMRPASSADRKTNAVTVSYPSAKRYVLFYRNPMGADTSPIPKKDSMGMDYVPVYADEENDNDNDAVQSGIAHGGFHLSADKVQMLGVTSVPARRSFLPAPDIDVTGIVQFDQRGLQTITTWSAGWVTHLYIATTGETVHKGQKMADIYAPDVAASEEEYNLAASSGQAMQRASVHRLQSLGIAKGEIVRLQKGGRPHRVFSLYAPANGVITDILVEKGTRLETGQPLYKMAALDKIWVIAAIPERLLAWVGEGTRARVSFPAFPGRVFEEKISLLYPALDKQARTVSARIEIHNGQTLLRENMYAHIILRPQSIKGDYVIVPVSALLNRADDGQAFVMIDKGQGHFAARAVQTGIEGQGDVAIVSGLKVGEKVVINAAFLLDSESNLRSALQGFDPDQGNKKIGTAPAPVTGSGLQP